MAPGSSTSVLEHHVGMDMGVNSVQIKCPNCMEVVRTDVNKEIGTGAYLAGTVLLLIG